MDRNRAIAAAIVIIVVSSGIIVAAWTTLSRPDVRIGYLEKDLHQLAFRVALVNGWFAEEGITVELKSYGNGALEMDAFLGDEIDMGYLGAAPALTKRVNQDIMVTILAAANLEGSAIMVRKADFDGGSITQIANLTGKSVFIPGPSTVQAFLLRLALNQSGLSSSDVTTLSTSPANMANSLSEAEPAFVAWEPFNARAEYDDLAVPLVLSGEIWPRHPCCVVASSNSFLAAHPDIAQTVIDIHVRAEEWIVSNPTAAIQIAAEWLEMEDAISAVETAFNRIIYDYNVNRTGIEMYLSYLIDQDILLPHKVPVDVEAFLDSFINTTFVEST
ncbi:MAG: ABC transporter substrate-binding protein [Candidatus Thorarchaeota archaeon]|nr:MAG: ABC transporter substrate-binding protein [Candidatus Thorarchaeota archaeon]